MPARQARLSATATRLNRSTAGISGCARDCHLGFVLSFVIALVLVLVLERKTDYEHEHEHEQETSTSKSERLRLRDPADIPSQARHPADSRTTRLCEKPTGDARRRGGGEDRRRSAR